MPNPPTIDETIALLRERLGPPSQEGEGLLRWWVNQGHTPKSIAVWVRGVYANPLAAALPGEPGVAWVTRPYAPEFGRCHVTSLEHLDGFISRIQNAARADGPESIKGLCEPEVGTA